MGRVEIRLLGGFEVEIDHRPVVDFESATARALLARLATEPGHAVSRAALAEMLWPGREHGAALANLRHTLSMLKTTLDDRDRAQPMLLGDAHDLRLAVTEDVDIDLVSFRALAAIEPEAPEARESWSTAAAVLRGPFLAGFDLTAGPEWDQWVSATRSQIQAVAIELLERLIQVDEARDDHGAVCRHAERLIAIDPWNEPAHRHKIEHLAAAGRRGDAIVHAERFIEALDAELSISPDPRTASLVRALRK